jgi:hypothetical protein
MAQSYRSFFVLTLELSSLHERARAETDSAQPDDLADALSFALRHEGRKSQHDSDRLNADIVAKRWSGTWTERGYVVMKKPPLGRHDQVARGFGQK